MSYLRNNTCLIFFSKHLYAVRMKGKWFTVNFPLAVIVKWKIRDCREKVQFIKCAINFD